MYATALKEVVEEHGIEAKANGTLLVQKMWNRTISGLKMDLQIKL